MTIIIDNKSYPFRFSIGAIRAYMERLQDNAKTESKTNSVDEVQAWIELGIKFGCKAEGETYDIKKPDLDQWMDDNFEKVCDIGAHCRKQIVIFNKALTTQVDDDDSKKKEV